MQPYETTPDPAVGPNWPAGPSAPPAIGDEPRPPATGDDPAPPSSTPRPRRLGRLRRPLLIGLVVLVVVLAVADRVAAHAAASQMSKQIGTSLNLPTKPEASVGGIPFLTQVVFGKYSDIGIGIRRIAVSNMCVDDIDVHLKGVHVPVSAMTGKELKSVPVDRVVGSVHLTFDDLNAYLADKPGHVSLAGSDKGVRVSAPVHLPIVGNVTMFGSVRASVSDNRLTMAPTGIGVEGLGALPVPADAVTTLTTTVPLSGLPMDMRLVSARTTSTGIDVTVQADHLKLDTTKPAPRVTTC